MGSCYSNSGDQARVKGNKNHNRQKLFTFGVSFGCNDINLEGHSQMGYNSKTIEKVDLKSSKNIYFNVPCQTTPEVVKEDLVS